MKKSEYNKLTPLEQVAIRELIRDTPTALNKKSKEAIKPHSELPLFSKKYRTFTMPLDHLSEVEGLAIEYFEKFKVERADYWSWILASRDPMTDFGATLALKNIVDSTVYNSLSMNQQSYLYIRFCELCNSSMNSHAE